MKTYTVEWHTFGYHHEERQAESEHELRAAIESECPERLPVNITEKGSDKYNMHTGEWKE